MLQSSALLLTSLQRRLRSSSSACPFLAGLNYSVPSIHHRSAFTGCFAPQDNHYRRSSGRSLFRPASFPGIPSSIDLELMVARYRGFRITQMTYFLHRSTVFSNGALESGRNAQRFGASQALATMPCGGGSRAAEATIPLDSSSRPGAESSGVPGQPALRIRCVLPPIRAGRV